MATSSDSPAPGDMDPDPRRTEPIDDPDVVHRLVSKADIDDYDDCWVWQGASNGTYGYARYRGKSLPVHRLIARVHSDSPLPPSLDVHHTCRHTLCINPAHLEGLPRGEHIREETREALQRGEAGKAGFTIEDIRSIRQRYGEDDIILADLASEYGVSIDMISCIARGDSYGYID